jgi:hypothetical protein
MQVDLSNVRALETGEDDVGSEAKSDLDINIDEDDDALLGAERDAEATRQAIKRKIAQAADVDVISRDLPPKLRINSDDPEDVVTALFPNPLCIEFGSLNEILSLSPQMNKIKIDQKIKFIFILMCRKQQRRRKYIRSNRKQG